MTPDIAEIRAALAAATPSKYNHDEHPDAVLLANAPTWLASLCDEIERLRAVHFSFAEHVEPLRAEITRLNQSLDSRQIITDAIAADCDAALAENERLRAENNDLFRSFPICSLSMQGGECSAEDRWKEVVALVVAERDAALIELSKEEQAWCRMRVERNAWRACADQLATMHIEAEAKRRRPNQNQIGEAVAEYERLGGHE